MNRCALVAQLDRVPGYEPGGRRFESSRARHSFPPLNFQVLYFPNSLHSRSVWMRTVLGSTKMSGTFLNAEGGPKGGV